MRRIVLFVLTNILVLTTMLIVFTILSTVFGIDFNYISEGTINFATLLIFSAVVGFTGALFSLAISRWMAKTIMGVHVLDPKSNLSADERKIVDTVHRLSKRAGLKKMPQVGVYHSPEVNAFATGPTKSRSLVAVSTGLLQSMDEDAVEGVLAHEVAHIANGDMVTMTLLQGVVNTFVVFLARIAAFVASRFVRSELQSVVHFIAVIAFQILFSLLGSLVVMAFSRHREYHADRGGAELAGKDKMIHALHSLKLYVNRVDTKQTALQTLKINNKRGTTRLFSSHPDLNDRIRRLKEY